jgi:hypothetical protein
VSGTIRFQHCRFTFLTPEHLPAIARHAGI